MNRAFTLIEQLAAIALASLFMLAALAALASLARERTGHHPREETGAMKRVADLLECDLVQSQRMRTTSQGIILSGFASLDDRMNPTHRPVRVEYRVEPIAGGSRLVRRQTSLDVLSNQNTRSDYVSDNVAKIEVIALAPPSRATTQSSSEIFGPADGQIIPAAVSLSISPAAGSQVALSRVVNLR